MKMWMWRMKKMVRMRVSVPLVNGAQMARSACLLHLLFLSSTECSFEARMDLSAMSKSYIPDPVLHAPMSTSACQNRCRNNICL